MLINTNHKQATQQEAIHEKARHTHAACNLILAIRSFNLPLHEAESHHCYTYATTTVTGTSREMPRWCLSTLWSGLSSPVADKVEWKWNYNDYQTIEIEVRHAFYPKLHLHDIPAIDPLRRRHQQTCESSWFQYMPKRRLSPRTNSHIFLSIYISKFTGSSKKHSNEATSGHIIPPVTNRLCGLGFRKRGHHHPRTQSPSKSHTTLE